ncbi:MAG: glycosyl hydrolase family 8, partial [Thermoleophilaceae bacterium]
VLALVGVVIVACGASSPPSQRKLAHRDAAAFLDRFVEFDGRVIRRDQGGDTVSEGQAYAMKLAVAIGDRKTFLRVWRWTRRHLQRSDGLLSWHWARDRVVDRQPAADADLDAAHALALAARRFGRRDFAAQARRIGRTLRATETVNTAAGGALVAGPWARSEGVVNPSYADPRAFTALARLGDRASWRRLARASTRMVARVAGRKALPPDWARASGGDAVASGAPGKPGPPTYSRDAVRVPIRFAAACSAGRRSIAAALWPRLRHEPGVLPRALGGAPLQGAGRSSVGLAGAAAAAAAAGKRAKARELLDEASGLERSRPTYYGSALVALTRVSVMSRMLGRCGA